MLGSVSKGLLLVKIHQQRGSRKSLNPNINQSLLKRKRRHVGAPTLSPVAHGRNIHTVEIRIPIVSFTYFRNEFAPRLERQRIAEMLLPNRAVLLRGFH